MTGVPLPFISFGGSSMISLSIALGLLLMIGKQIKKEDKLRKQRQKYAKTHNVVTSIFIAI